MSVATTICPEIGGTRTVPAMTSPYTFSEASALVEATVDGTALVTNFWRTHLLLLRALHR